MPPPLMRDAPARMAADGTGCKERELTCKCTYIPACKS